jgi:hypothetical protein
MASDFSFSQGLIAAVLATCPIASVASNAAIAEPLSVGAVEDEVERAGARALAKLRSGRRPGLVAGAGSPSRRTG